MAHQIVGQVMQDVPYYDLLIIMNIWYYDLLIIMNIWYYDLLIIMYIWYYDLMYYYVYMILWSYVLLCIYDIMIYWLLCIYDIMILCIIWYYDNKWTCFLSCRKRVKVYHKKARHSTIYSLWSSINTMISPIIYFYSLTSLIIFSNSALSSSLNQLCSSSALNLYYISIIYTLSSRHCSISHYSIRNHYY
jgi:hypothetical protein